MSNFQKGDVQGFNIILEKYNKPLYRYLLRMMNGSVSNAEDLFQDVFLKVLEKKNDYNTEKKFKTWLYTIARNTSIDFIRKENYRNHSSLDQSAYKLDDFSNVSRLDLVKSKNKDPESYYYEKELGSLINKNLNLLNNEFKEVFVLKEIEGLKFHEIAEITDSPVSTVKSRMRYAIKKLKSEIEKSGFYPKMNNVSEA